jgi:hypothetical protein
MEETIQSLRITFTLAVETDNGVSVFWLVLACLAIIEDDERREAKRRKRKAAFAAPRPF